MDNFKTASPASPVVNPIPVQLTTTPAASVEPTPTGSSANVVSSPNLPPPYTTVQKTPPRKKYFLIAAGVIFFIILAGVAGYYLLAPQTKEASLQPVNQNPQPTQVAIVTPAPPKFDLLVESPTSEAVVKSAKINVSGKTEPNTAVVFYTEADQNSVESDANGNFEGTVSLAPGINSLIVSAFGNQGEEKSVSLNLVFDNQI